MSLLCCRQAHASCVGSLQCHKRCQHRCAAYPTCLTCNQHLHCLKLDCVFLSTHQTQAGSKLLVANIGDSRCMLGRISSEGAVTSVALSVDHIPDLASEAARIRALGVRPTPHPRLPAKHFVWLVLTSCTSSLYLRP